MAKQTYGAGAETSEPTEFTTYETNATVVSDYVKTGSYSYKIDYNNVATGDSPDIACRMSWSNIPSYVNWAVHFQLYIDTSAPSRDVVLCGGGGATSELTTARKLKIGATTGTTVLAVDTHYQIEVRADRTSDGKAYVRINESDEFNVAVNATPSTSFYFGMSEKPNSGADAATTVRMDDIYLWTSTSAGTDELPPWLNTTLLDYRTVNAAGNYDGYGTQTPSGTAHLNVDDYAPSDGDTSYNLGGTMNAIERQTHNLANVTPSGTIKGFTVFSRLIDQINTDESAAGTRKLSIRQDTTDYETALAQDANDSYKTELIGYGEMPDGTALAVSDIDGLDVGSYIEQDFVTTTNGPLNIGIMEPDEVEVPTGDGADDGSFTTSTGGGNAWDHVDVISSSGDYIESSTNGHKQGFTVPAPGTTGMSIGSVRINTRAGRSGGSGTVSMRCFYRSSGGTYYYTDTQEVAAGTQYQLFDEWQTNPDTGNPWTGAEISGGNFGVELVDIKSGTSLRVYGFNINIAKVSGLKETSYWVVTGHGDAPTEFEVGEAIKDPILTSGVIPFAR